MQTLILREDHRKKYDISLILYFNVILWLKRKSKEPVKYKGIVYEVLKQYFNIKTGPISLKLWREWENIYIFSPTSSGQFWWHEINWQWILYEILNFKKYSPVKVEEVTNCVLL